MTAFTYFFLEILMLFVLYKAGLKLKRNYRITSLVGFSAIFIYSFVIGMRFGRGIDYNVYWGIYDDVSKGLTYEKGLTFSYICKFMNFLNLPYQVLIVIMSITFIVGVLLLMKNYRDVVPYALPLFVLFSQLYVENMVRWYFAYSFLLIGVAYLLRYGILNKAFLFFSIIACLLHIAIIPIPIIFCLLFLLKKPILSPVISIPLFFVIYLGFNTNYMSDIVKTVQTLTLFSDSAYGHYVDDADYWLTGGFLGLEKSGNIGFSNLFFLMLLVYYGYKIALNKSKQFVFAYNAFLFGLFLYPISLLIELVERYDMTFFFFRAIILSYILFYSKEAFKRQYSLFRPILLMILLWTNSYMLTSPFIHSEKYFMFVWDHTNETKDDMISAWENHAEEINSNGK